MKTEQTNTNIYKKLLAFQKLGISVKKDGKNPHFKSQYATLNEVLDKVKKPLNDLGVVILFEPTGDGLQTKLYCTDSDTFILGFMNYVDCGNAQKLLSCNTYFRRGTLVSLLGLEDEDDDGNKASAPAPTPTPEPVNVAQWIAEMDKAKTLAQLATIWDCFVPRVKSTKEVLAHKELLKLKLK